MKELRNLLKRASLALPKLKSGLKHQAGGLREVGVRWVSSHLYMYVLCPSSWVLQLNRSTGLIPCCKASHFLKCHQSLLHSVSLRQNRHQPSFHHGITLAVAMTYNTTLSFMKSFSILPRTRKSVYLKKTRVKKTGSPKAHGFYHVRCLHDTMQQPPTPKGKSVACRTPPRTFVPALF